MSDRETVQQIRENPYLQFFLGYEKYSAEASFDPSLMTHFRERISEDMLSRINEAMIEAERRAQGVGAPMAEKGGGDGGDSSSPAGVLVIDATCVPEDMRYPTDIGLLNEAREVTERVIDRLWAALSPQTRAGKRKPRTYRRTARLAYLSAVRLKKPKAGRCGAHVGSSSHISRGINYYHARVAYRWRCWTPRYAGSGRWLRRWFVNRRHCCR